MILSEVRTVVPVWGGAARGPDRGLRIEQVSAAERSWFSILRNVDCSMSPIAVLQLRSKQRTQTPRR